MKPPVLVSICIPAYKNIAFLGRLLDSISIQTFTDYEVIVTDDSGDNSVEEFVTAYVKIIDLSYYKNKKALGTPENWNEGVRKAKGEWIKIMHDDDWFSCADSLQLFMSAVKKESGRDFFYSAYRNVYTDGSVSKKIVPSWLRRKLLLLNPASLLSKNIIGPPSVTIYKKKLSVVYDNNLKWLVDIEFYTRYIASNKPMFLNDCLVDIGISEQQVTQSSSMVREIEVPEYFHFLNCAGKDNLLNILVFDAWWRLLRNLDIRSVEDIRLSEYSGEIPSPIISMVDFQKRIRRSLLQIGIISKLIMVYHYLFGYRWR